MAAGHVSALHVLRATAVHRMRPQCKLVAAVVFVLVVVATPREQVWAYAAYAALLAGVAAAAQLPLALVARRLTVEAPFVAFALFLPFLAGGDRVDVGPVLLSVDGLWAAWNILAKGTLGVATSVLLTATTTLPDVIRGMERLHAPRALTAILGFMIRYAEVITGEVQRMKIARESRGHDPRWIWQAKAIAHSAGTLFIRSYERGERVYLAMTSRGYDGALPRLADAVAPRREWLTAASVPAVALVVAVSAWAAR